MVYMCSHYDILKVVEQNELLLVHAGSSYLERVYYVPPLSG